MTNKAYGTLNNSLKICALLLAPFILVSCVTPYQEKGISGGVSAYKISSDVYRVEARGNAYTSSTTIQDYVLLKSAEITLQAGATHFLLLGSNNATRHSVITTPTTIQTNAHGRGIYTRTPQGGIYSGTAQARSQINHGTTIPIVKHGQDVFIRILRVSPASANRAGAFNAQDIFDSISPRVKRSK